MYLNIVCKTEGTGLKPTNSSVAANSVVSHWALLNDLPQIEEFQRASKINNHLNPKTGYFNRGEYFHFAKTIPIQGKKKPQHLRVRVLTSVPTENLITHRDIISCSSLPAI